MFRYRYRSIKSSLNSIDCAIDRAVAQFIFEARSSVSKPKHPAKFRRLTREEAAARGVSYSAKRQVDASVKRITQSTPIYTERQAVQMRLGTTKERYKEDIRARRRSYANETIKKRQENAKNSRTIRDYLPDIAPKDKAVALKHYKSGYHGLTPAEKKRFNEMFKRYPADSVRQALGSAPKDIGRFGIAA
jgi:hypothetical protein